MSATARFDVPRKPWEIVGLYSLFAVCWIIGSDYLVETLFEHHGPAHTVKGLLFVGLTGSLLYLMLRRVFARMEDSQRQIELLLAEVRSLTAHELNSREAERARIARDLHDQLGQELTALKYRAALLNNSLPREEWDGRVYELAERIDELIRSVRRVATQLRPGMLDQLGLAATLEWLAAEFEKNSSIRTSVVSTAKEPGVEHSTALFRIAQECLTNVARHSNATEVQITLTQSGHQVCLVVTDNGRGMTTTDRTGGFGLLGIRERLRAIGGHMKIERAEPSGTRVIVTVDNAIA